MTAAPDDTEAVQIAALLGQIVQQLRMLNVKMDELIARADAYKPSARTFSEHDAQLALYSRGRCMCSELRHGLSPARSRRPDGPTAQAGGRLSARNLHAAARKGQGQGA